MNKFLSLLGLCKRAAKLVAGEVAAEQAIRGKQPVYLLLLAEDASANTKKKFKNSAAYYQIPILEIGQKEALGKAIGADVRSILAITEEGFAKKLQQLAEAILAEKEKTERSEETEETEETDKD